jgi:hypothetical protein
MVPTVSLSFLNRGKVKQVCRVCHGIAELKTERLCADCSRIKGQILFRFADAVRGRIAVPAEQQCKRSGCSCAACDGRTLEAHSLYLFDLARADRREIPGPRRRHRSGLVRRAPQENFH